MSEKTLKDKLFLGWLVLILAVMYANDAYEKIYYLKSGLNFPHRWTVRWIIIVIFTITLVAIAVSSRKKENKNDASFGRSFLIACAATTFTRFIGNKTDSIMRYATDIDKAARDIILWYVFGFVASVIICAILEYFETRRKKNTTDICENNDE